MEIALRGLPFLFCKAAKLDAVSYTHLGAGEFLRDGKMTSRIEASEWYEFDGNEQIIKICSYCIPEK